MNAIDRSPGASSSVGHVGSVIDDDFRLGIGPVNSCGTFSHKAEQVPRGEVLRAHLDDAGPSRRDLRSSVNGVPVRPRCDQVEAEIRVGGGHVFPIVVSIVYQRRELGEVPLFLQRMLYSAVATRRSLPRGRYPWD